MQYPSAYYLLLIYLTLVCKPVIPLLQDMWSHTFYEAEHMATVHHDQGNNHVHYELGKLAKEDGTSNTTKSRSFDEIAFHIPVINKLAISSPEHLLAMDYFDRPFHLPVSFTAIHLPPPKL